jgi:large subunit ribosomal protein L10
MRKEDKKALIDSMSVQLAETSNLYLADISGMNAEDTSDLRRLCFKYNITLRVVKNTLLKKSMDAADRDFDELYEVLKGNTAVMFTETGNAPAKLIKEFRKSKKSESPILKAAYIEQMTYVGNDQLDFLVAIKSREELIADVIALLQSPVKNVVGALQSGGNKLSGILETLSEKSE